MHFTQGQTVVHPHHGPATIRSITTRTVRKAETRYLILEIQDTNLVVGVPLDNAESAGIRAVFNKTEIEQLFDVMREPTGFEEDQWSRRVKEAEEKLRSGDIYAVATVVRNLIRRSARGNLSLVEKSMLKHAKRPLVSEVSLALGLEEQEAETLIDALPGLADQGVQSLLAPTGSGSKALVSV